MGKLHIVSFDNPFPPNYGGAIDVYYKIKALSAIGFEIYLHCFQYGDKQSENDLNQICRQVFYYKRKIGLAGISAHTPYIVYSRRDQKLLSRLCETQAPILFEGLHSTYYMNNRALKNRFKIVRCHNVEHDYYKSLSDRATGYKKAYYWLEAKLLKNYESRLNNAQILLPISQNDTEYFQQKFSNIKTVKTTAFHSNYEIDLKTGEGSYLLFHGSLQVIENELSALFLINNIAPYVSLPVIIAGSNPSAKLNAASQNCKNVELISNPKNTDLNILIKNAHIHLLYASQKSGLKLKFLKALHSGRFVIANPNMATEDNLQMTVRLANSIKEWIQIIEELSKKSFTEEMKSLRIQILKEYSNTHNAENIKNLILY